jgi:crotonobetainyl-CoA:carnitine CoA-transferase CaiB-like acyl-CoA transferase
VYRTADDRFVAAAPLEDRFWHAFCDTIELPEALRDDSSNPQAVIAAVSERIRRRTAAEWRTAFSGRDACCAVVADLAEALADPHFRARGLFAHTLEGGGDEIPALPVPVAQGFRNPAPAAAPSLGEAAGLLGPKPPRNG